uniref:Uncharacterized protein n=1 Tax=Caenorhabditis tropicalis TaxID=1561998 RepID=A0A1I7UR51_9PELO
MEGTNSWVEQNLQRQRKMLEDKQKQKRNQSAGSVRTTTSTASTTNTSFNMNSMSSSDYPTFDNSLPFSLSDSMSSNMSTPLIQAPPRAQSMGRQAPMPQQEPLISIESDLAAKLSRQNLSSVVVSDDEDDRNSYADSPWNNDVAESPMNSSTARLFEIAKEARGLSGRAISMLPTLVYSKSLTEETISLPDCFILFSEAVHERLSRGGGGA